MKKQTVCPKTKAPCRFCSNESERQIRRFSDLKTSREGKKIVYVDKGEFCNNDGRHYIKDLQECPVPAALAAPLVPLVIDERTWMRMRT